MKTLLLSDINKIKNRNKAKNTKKILHNLPKNAIKTPTKKYENLSTRPLTT